MIVTREQISAMRRWVIKIGSALLTDEGRGLNTSGIADWARQIVLLRQQGVEVVLVSSGAVAEGMARLGWTSRPHALHELQAAAAVGQAGLLQSYESHFRTYGLHAAQILLSHDDLSSRNRYLNARSTLSTLLKLGCIPIVNENDTVVTDEIRFGDNDTLSALVANLIEADMLVILTDQGAMYDSDPRIKPDAAMIHEIAVNAPGLEAMAGGSGHLGRGGMRTKVRAARLAARSGSVTVVAGGREADILRRVRSGEQIGTLFIPDIEPLQARKQWLAGHLKMRGTLVLDEGAVKMLCEAGKSLLPVGVIAVDGNFERGEMVACVNREGSEIGRGLVNYGASETRRIMGRSSRDIEAELGYVDEPELIHRDNLVLS